MTFPKVRDVDIPLLSELERAGGSARPRDLYRQVAKRFPNLTEEDLTQRLESSPSIYKWNNMVQWARQRLVEKGAMDPSVRGIWKITEEGRRILKEFTEERGKAQPPPELTLHDLINDYEETLKRQLLQRLKNLEPAEFEQFSKRLLEALGFVDVIVTQISRDGGIDGHGKLRRGIVNIDAAFQSKKWEGTVPRPEIDKFRGAISGQFDQGIFITTSSYSDEATAASIRKGTVPIILIDGAKTVDLMITHEIGVSRRPLYLISVDEDYWKLED